MSLHSGRIIAKLGPKKEVGTLNQGLQKKDRGVGAQQWYQSQLDPEEKGLEMNKEKGAELPLDSTPTFEGPTKVLFLYVRGTRAKPNDIKSAGDFWLVSIADNTLSV